MAKLAVQAPLTHFVLLRCSIINMQVIHGIIAWLDAYGIGANDVANAFGEYGASKHTACLPAALLHRLDARVCKQVLFDKHHVAAAAAAAAAGTSVGSKTLKVSPSRFEH
jgi:phosphate/sulfate permease